ncbi:Isochorismatase hydrolase [Fistulina hepatica ATCC 64428]|uniref:nicotinamidase n=1 Tax=Fistulina hepatica ATCC 64428 TaxID=1128425 RepID=A0A0D7AA15_9AGAR|nr:Isochorismatase hydrolase [Fistulina hepatica ATCC 64428]
MPVPEGFSPALLVIDVQYDFCPPDGSLAVASGLDILPTVNTLLAHKAFVTRIATRDFHPPDHISFAPNHAPPDNVPFVSSTTVVNPENPNESYTTRLWPVHCVQGTHGSELHAGLNLAKIDKVVCKGTGSRVEMYSAFHDPFQHPCISDSGLADMLRAAGATWVYVVGLATDYCVKASALDAKRAGFNVVVIAEGTRAVDPACVPDVVAELEAEDVKFVSMKDEEVRQWLGLDVDQQS